MFVMLLFVRVLSLQVMSEQSNTIEREASSWTTEQLATCDKLLEWMMLIDSKDPITHSPTPLCVPLDNESLRACVRLLLSDLHAALNLPYMPRDLCDLIVSYAVTPVESTYYMFEAASTALCDNWQCQNSIGISVNKGAYTDRDARHWCINTLMHDSKLLDGFDERAWTDLYFAALEVSVDAISTDQLFRMVLNKSNSTAHRHVIASTTSLNVLGSS
jgi:hypothetical protein